MRSQNMVTPTPTIRPMPDDHSSRVARLESGIGRAVATHVRVGDPLFTIVFPVILGALLWGWATRIISKHLVDAVLDSERLQSLAARYHALVTEKE